MKIFLASDHAGFALKEFINYYLTNLGYNIEDCGAYDMNPIDDYPDFIIPVARKVARNLDARGIIMGGSGQGEAIAANRINGIVVKSTL